MSTKKIITREEAMESQNQIAEEKCLQDELNEGTVKQDEQQLKEQLDEQEENGMESQNQTAEERKTELIEIKRIMKEMESKSLLERKLDALEEEGISLQSWIEKTKQQLDLLQKKEMELEDQRIEELFDEPKEKKMKEQKRREQKGILSEERIKKNQELSLLKEKMSMYRRNKLALENQLKKIEENSHVGRNKITAFNNSLRKWENEGTQSLLEKEGDEAVVQRYFMEKNEGSLKKDFFAIAIKTTDFDDAIQYLLKVKPLLHEHRLSEEQIALLKPYDDIHKIMEEGAES